MDGFRKIWTIVSIWSSLDRNVCTCRVIKIYVKFTWVDFLLSDMSKYTGISIEMPYNALTVLD